MKKVGLAIVAAAACALLSAIPLAAASDAAAKANQNSTAAAKANKKTPAAKVKTNKKTTKAKVKHTAWRPETITGKIAAIDPAKKLVVVNTPGGVPFDMVVTPKTRIDMANQPITLQDLTRDTNRNASVKFIPERRGDVASSIQVGG